MPYGRQLLSGQNQVLMTRVSADGKPQYKPGGVTIAMSSLAAALVADLTLPDGSIIKTGQQYLRYGQVICRISNAEIQTLTITGLPTGGTFTLTNGSQTTGAITFSTTEATTAANIQAALVALTSIGAGGVVVTSPGTDLFTLTFASALGDVALLTGNFAGLTGGTAPAGAITNTYSGADYGKYGPYDPAATDGRQTLTRGECYVLDELWLPYESGTPMLSPLNDNTGGVIEGGLIWLDRVLQSGSATHTLAAGPTKAEFLAAFPRFSFARTDA